MKREIFLTADGSSTIRIESINEHYHSVHGALQESKHVFIRNGLECVKQKKRIRIFELGFGTGLNALLSAQFSEDYEKDIEYTGIEAYPVEVDLIAQLNYPNFVSNTLKEMYCMMHQLSWNELHVLSSKIKFTKIKEKMEKWDGPRNAFDIVFFDAFGPRVQGELWQLDILRKIHSTLDFGGIFVTYCAKGQLKRDLLALGFQVESLPGPPGKREMTRAIKRD